MTSGNTSDTFPFSPYEPSSVVNATLAAIRLASSAPNIRSPVEAPSTASIRQPRVRKASASMNNGAEPYPPPTRTQFAGSRGSAKGRPSGPTTSIGSYDRWRDSHAVPLPVTEKMNSTVPP